MKDWNDGTRGFFVKFNDLELLRNAGNSCFSYIEHTNLDEEIPLFRYENNDEISSEKTI